VEFAPREFIDGDVAPTWFVTRAIEVGRGDRAAGEIVMVEKGVAILEHLIEHVARRDIEWEGGEILHDDEVVALQGVRAVLGSVGGDEALAASPGTNRSTSPEPATVVTSWPS